MVEASEGVAEGTRARARRSACARAAGRLLLWRKKDGRSSTSSTTTTTISSSSSSYSSTERVVGTSQVVGVPTCRERRDAARGKRLKTRSRTENSALRPFVRACVARSISFPLRRSFPQPPRDGGPLQRAASHGNACSPLRSAPRRNADVQRARATRSAPLAAHRFVLSAAPRFRCPRQSFSLALPRRFIDWLRDGAGGVHENVVLAPSSSSSSSVADRARRGRGSSRLPVILVVVVVVLVVILVIPS